MYEYFNLFGMEIGSFPFCLGVAYVFSTLMFLINGKKLLPEKTWVLILLPIILITVGFWGSVALATIEFIFLKHYPANFFENYGKSYYGGMILSLTTGVLLAKWRKIPYSTLLRVSVPSIFLGYAIGRMGCFFSGDGCYGIRTDSWLGMTFPHGAEPTFVKVYPTPLFEAVYSILLFFLFQYFNSRTSINSHIYNCTALISLALSRFLIEFIRVNDKYYSLSLAQWISVFLIIFCALYILYRYILHRNTSLHPGNNSPLVQDKERVVF